MKKYLSVRAYPKYYGSSQNDLVNNFFNNGWQYEAAHEIKNADGSTCVDYILSKEINDEITK